MAVPSRSGSASVTARASGAPTPTAVVRARSSSARHRAPPSTTLRSPRTAPSLVVAAQYLDGRGTLETVDPATGHRRVVGSPTRTDFFAQPRYAPDGDHVVAELVHRDEADFMAHINGSSLVVVDLVMGTVGPPLTAPALFAEHSDWGANGSSSSTAPHALLGGHGPVQHAPGRLPPHPRHTPGRPGRQRRRTVLHARRRVLFTAQVLRGSEYALMVTDLSGRRLDHAIAGTAVAGVHARMNEGD